MATTVADRRGAPLSRERILEASESLLRDEGADAFSMRRLAARLDVSPMAIYKWFDSRDALLSALTDRTMLVALPIDDSAAPWADRVVAIAVAMRTAMLGNRQLLRLVGAPRRIDGLLAVASDRLLGLMLELGYHGVEAVEAYRVVFWSVIDHCLVIDADDAMPATADDYQPDRAVRIAIESADEPLPHIEAMRSHIGRVDRDHFFEKVVRTLALGIEAGAPAGER